MMCKFVKTLGLLAFKILGLLAFFFYIVLHLVCCTTCIEESNINKLRDTLEVCCNPFAFEGQDLINIVTKTVMPAQVIHDMSNAYQIGADLYKTFVQQRITSGEAAVWAPIKKCNLQTWKSLRKVVKHSLSDKVVELKEDRSLFTRFVIAAMSHSDLDFKEAIELYEFAVFPRSLFDPSGTLLPCTDKSKLMAILEASQKDNAKGDAFQENRATKCEKNVLLVDGMAAIQEFGKPATAKTGTDWAAQFISKLDHSVKDYNEFHLVFDRYDSESGLKASTR